jgi:MarR family transcriptional repressor of emrRAB
MTDSFAPFQLCIDRIGTRLKGSPRQDVMLIRLYYHVGNRLSERYGEWLKDYGINQSEWFALLCLYACEGNAMKPSELSVMMHSSRTNSTRLADELVKRGWVERRPCQSDRRQLYLALTPAGTAFVEQLLPIGRTHARALWAGFTSEEKNTLEALLRKLLKQMGG